MEAARDALPDYILAAMQELPHNVPWLRTADMVMRDPPIDYLVEGMLPSRGVAAIYGAPSVGKSFLAFDLVANLAYGSDDWFFIPMRAARVVYVALEGQGGLSQRIRAWQRHNGLDLEDRLLVSTHPLRLDDPSGIEALAEQAVTWAGKGCVVVIDTLAQAMAGLDENSPADMGTAIAGAQRLSELVEGLVLLIHHIGKDARKGLRGHSSLRGALDAAIEVNAKPAGRSWSVEKSKDGESGQAHGFELVVYEVGANARGRTVTSCAVAPTILAAAKPADPTGANQIAILATLATLTANGAPPPTLTQLIEAVAPNLGCEERRRKWVAKETIKKLLATGVLNQAGEIIWRPT